MTDFPEAPASVTYSITSKGGFNILFTVRAESGLDLLDTMDAVEKKLIAKEYKPQIKQVFGQKKEVEYVPGMICPMCNIGKVKIIRKEGKVYNSCDQSKFNPTTKLYDGCKYFKDVTPTGGSTNFTNAKHAADDDGYFGEPH